MWRGDGAITGRRLALLLALAVALPAALATLPLARRAGQGCVSAPSAALEEALLIKVVFPAKLLMGSYRVVAEGRAEGCVTQSLGTILLPSGRAVKLGYVEWCGDRVTVVIGDAVVARDVKLSELRERAREFSGAVDGCTVRVVIAVAGIPPVRGVEGFPKAAPPELRQELRRRALAAVDECPLTKWLASRGLELRVLSVKGHPTLATNRVVKLVLRVASVEGVVTTSKGSVTLRYVVDLGKSWEFVVNGTAVPEGFVIPPPEDELRGSVVYFYVVSVSDVYMYSYCGGPRQSVSVGAGAWGGAGPGGAPEPSGQLRERALRALRENELTRGLLDGGLKVFKIVADELGGALWVRIHAEFRGVRLAIDLVESGGELRVHEITVWCARG